MHTDEVRTKAINQAKLGGNRDVAITCALVYIGDQLGELAKSASHNADLSDSVRMLATEVGGVGVVLDRR